MLRGLLGVALMGFAVVGEARADSFYGAFICDFEKMSPSNPDGGFKVGDQIFLGVDDYEISWISALGPGLRYDCTRTGNILVCPLGEAKDYVALNLKQPNSIFDMNTKKFIRAVAIFQEEWQCKRFKLARSSGVNPSDPE